MNWLIILTKIIFNPVVYIKWLERKSNKNICDYTKGCGYYLPLGLLGGTLIGKEEVWDMQSGRKMRVKLIGYKKYLDPSDMVHESYWQYIGYENEKMFSEMSFIEFLAVS